MMEGRGRFLPFWSSARRVRDCMRRHIESNLKYRSESRGPITQALNREGASKNSMASRGAKKTTKSCSFLGKVI